MSSRNTMIILLALVTAGASLGLGGALMEPINEQRADLQLTFNPQVTENLPATEAVLYTSLGCFRGLIANMLWMRANTLKENGQFYEAMELSDLISRLQPRFPQVWIFNSWNMAYNISVATHTARERWMWVNAGVELLRDRGIPMNPTSSGLHRQLSWIFLHKIGQYSDDMHWYYKQRLALEWQELLGVPPAGSTTAALAWFAPIAEMDQRYFAVDELTSRTQDQLRKWMNERADLKPMMSALSLSEPVNFSRRAREGAGELTEADQAIAASLRRMADENERRLALLRQPAVARFEADHPQAGPLLDALRAAGFELDDKLMQRLGRSRLRLDAMKLGYKVLSVPGEEKADEALGAWLNEGDAATPAPGTAKLRDEVVLPFLRAKVLREHYHMSGSYMYRLMLGDWLRRAGEEPATSTEGEHPFALPLDWRHPASHGLYWAALGVKVGQVKLNKVDNDYFEILNTDRQVLHSLQALVHAGDVSFDPVIGYYDTLPDPRFIDSYEQALFGAGERIGGIYAESAAPQSFEAGHENFLIWCIDLAYFYGHKDKAQQLYAKLGRRFGLRQADRLEKYSQPLEQFVFSRVKENITSLDDARTIITGQLRQAIVAGFADDRPRIAASCLQLAQQVHEYYQGQQNYKTFGTDRNRMGLPPFDQMKVDTFAQVMGAPAGQVPIVLKQRIWLNALTPTDLKQATWDRIRPALLTEAANQPGGLTPEERFPEPPGMLEYRKTHPATPLRDDPLPGNNLPGAENGG